MTIVIDLGMQIDVVDVAHLIGVVTVVGLLDAGARDVMIVVHLPAEMIAVAAEVKKGVMIVVVHRREAPLPRSVMIAGSPRRRKGHQNGVTKVESHLRKRLLPSVMIVMSRRARKSGLIAPTIALSHRRRKHLMVMHPSLRMTIATGQTRNRQRRKRTVMKKKLHQKQRRSRQLRLRKRAMTMMTRARANHLRPNPRRQQRSLQTTVTVNRLHQREHRASVEHQPRGMIAGHRRESARTVGIDLHGAVAKAKAKVRGMIVGDGVVVVVVVVTIAVIVEGIGVVTAGEKTSDLVTLILAGVFQMYPKSCKNF